MRIGIVTETYPPEINGVARTVERMARWLRDRGHDVFLLYPQRAGNPAPDFEGYPVRGVPIPFYTHLRMGLPPSRRVVSALDARPADILYVATEGPLGAWAIKHAADRGIPVVSGFHTNFHIYAAHYGLGILNRPAYAYLRRLHNRTARTLVPTATLKNRLTSGGFRNVDVLARGVDSGLFNPARRSEALRREWGLDGGDPAVLYVGRLAPEKNLKLLVRAFNAMRQNAARSKLILVGDGPSRRRMQAALPRAVFCGEQVGESLASHYASADVFLFPSMTETYGNVTLEAMASGLAVVAFDYAAAVDLIQDREEGLLAPFGNARAFVAGAASLAANPSFAAKLGAAARKKADRCTWDRVLVGFEQILVNCVTGGNERGTESERAVARKDVCL